MYDNINEFIKNNKKLDYINILSKSNLHLNINKLSYYTNFIIMYDIKNTDFNKQSKINIFIQNKCENITETNETRTIYTLLPVINYKKHKYYDYIVNNSFLPLTYTYDQLSDIINMCNTKYKYEYPYSESKETKTETPIKRVIKDKNFNDIKQAIYTFYE